MTEINRKFWCKNDRNMTGVLYGGVRGFWGRRCSIITTLITVFMIFHLQEREI